ncbi:MAG TPA: hypothetical protein VHW03_04130 [Chthoniobacterales bacterium]|nr:hypothetical protein [Chthoniobacterales bacterium]
MHADSYSWLANYLLGLGRFNEAAAVNHEAIELQPAAVTYHGQLAVIEILRGDVQAALAAVSRESSAPPQEIVLALARQISPDRAAADAALKHLIDQYAELAPYQLPRFTRCAATQRICSRGWTEPGPTAIRQSTICSSTRSSCATSMTRTSPRFAARWACPRALVRR